MFCYLLQSILDAVFLDGARILFSVLDELINSDLRHGVFPILQQSKECRRRYSGFNDVEFTLVDLFCIRE